MKKKKERKLPYDVKIDRELDKYLEMGLFQKKIDKANEMLKIAGVPKATK